VIPTVNFGLEGSYDFCFEGIEKGSAVALSTYMVQEKDGREAQKDFFMSGYNEMMRRIEPETVICYHEPFPEMTGNIVYVNYELSSWRHMNDDIQPGGIKQAGYAPGGHTDADFGAYMIPACKPAQTDYNDAYRVGGSGFQVQMGAGSAYGGKWVPKNEDDERFWGRPNELIRTHSARYNRDTLIGVDGRAAKERHYTDHGYPKYHSNPHDHILQYAPNGSPDWNNSEQVNYFDGAVPEFKAYIREVDKMVRIIKGNTPEQNAFKTIAEFQDCMRRHGEVEFCYRGVFYSIIHAPYPYITIGERASENKPVKEESIVHYESSEDLLNYVIGGKNLREIITQVTVTDRTI
jgi:hypothetical protein